MKLEKLSSKEPLTLLGAIIKLNRLSQNMSQAGLAEGICVPSYLSKIENGEIVPSIEVLHLLFHQLDIEYVDDEQFIHTHHQLIRDYFDEVSCYGLEKANVIFHELQSKETQLIHSSLIVDYYLLKLAHLTATPNREEYDALKHQLEQVISVLTPDQQYTYHLYIALDNMLTCREMADSVHDFKQATKHDPSGKSYYFLAVAYVKMGRYYEAITAVEQATKRYLEQAQLSQLITCHELKALLAYRLNGRDEAVSLLHQVIEMATTINRKEMSLNALSFLAYLSFKAEDDSKTIKYLKQAIKIANGLHYQSDITIILSYLSQQLQRLSKLSPEIDDAILTFSQQDEFNDEKRIKQYVEKSGHHLFVDFFIFDLTLEEYMKTRRYKEAVHLIQKGYLFAPMMRKIRQ